MNAVITGVARLRDLPRFKWVRSAPTLVAVALLALLAVRGTDLLRHHAVSPLPVAGLASAPHPLPTVDVSAIQRARLFGGEGAPAGPAVIASGLVLSGVLADQDPARGVAMLGPAVESIALYRVGEEVPNGARLQSIYPTYVLLLRGGQTQRLDILSVQPGTGAPLLASDDPEARRLAVARLQAQVPLEPGKLFRTQIVRSDGKLQGLRIYPGPAQKIFERSGLRRGDVVVAVNGYTVADLEGRGDLMRVLTVARRARVTITRDGSQQEVDINLDESST